jgi:hypothetical protein
MNRIAHRLTLVIRARVFFVVCLAVMCAGSLSAQPRYQFTVIADNPGCQVGSPALNNSGQTAFGISTCSSPADAQVLRANVGELTKIFGIQGQSTYGSLAQLIASINDAGTVAFYAYKASPFVPVILTGSGGPLTTIADPSTDGQFSSVVSPSIHNSADAVAFQATLADGSGDAVFRASGGQFTTIAGPGTVITGMGTLYGAIMPTINRNGTVLFSAWSAFTSGIAFSDGTSAAVVSSEPGSGFNGFNDANTATFNTGSAVYSGNGGPLTLIASLSDGFASFDNVSSINNAGQVVFEARTSTNAPGLYTGPDPVADKVVAPGDTIAGLGTVRYAQMGVEAINDNGQIAFVVAYDPGDGSTRLAVVRADPLCAANISATVSVMSGQAKLNRKSGRYTQSVTLKNGDGPVSGPVSLVLDGLSNGVTLFNASGTTTACGGPSGSPYINVDIGADAVFSSRERATVTLEFVNPSGGSISYAPRVLGGPGNR